MMKGLNRRYSHGHGHGGHGPTNDPSYIEAGHLTDHMEYRELNFRSIVQFMIALVAVVAVSYISMYGMMVVFQAQHEERMTPLSPVADTAWSGVKPDIQVAPHVDLTKYRWSEDSILSGQKGEGIIPIEEAIKQVAAEGLPYRQGTAQEMTPAAAPAPQQSDSTAAQNGAAKETTGANQPADTSRH